LSPRRDTAAVETMDTRRSLAGTGFVHESLVGTVSSRFDIKCRPTAGISDIFVN